MSCTAKKLVVKNSDSLIQYQVTKRIPLYASQKKQLSIDIKKFLNTHKKEANELKDSLDLVKIGDQSNFITFYQESETIYRKLAADFSYILSKQLAQLDKKQQLGFIQNIYSENKKILNKSTKEKVEETQERFSKFFGSITPNQKTIIESFSTDLTESKNMIIMRREDLAKRLLSIYGSENSTETKIKSIHEVLKSHIDSYLNSNKNFEMAKSILPTLDQPQKDNVKMKAEEIKEIINYYIQTEY